MRKKINFGILLVFLSAIAISGCMLGDDDSGVDGAITGTEGLTMDFYENYPRATYVVNDAGDDILVIVDVRNKGTYSPTGEIVIGGVPSGGKMSFIEFLETYRKEDYLEILSKEGSKIFGPFIGELISKGVITEEEGADIIKDDGEIRLASLKNRVYDYLKSNPSILVNHFEDEYKTYSDNLENLPPSSGQSGSQTIKAAGNLYLSGFDPNIIDFSEDGTSKVLDGTYLQAVSNFNPVGGLTEVEFGGKINAGKILTTSYEANILATACYPYVTKAGPSVCIDPRPFDRNQEKVCEIGSHSLTSQGAPIAVTRVDQEASTNKIQFKITIKNVGGGDVISLDALGKCDPYGSERLERDDFDRLQLLRVMVGSTELDCEPFVDEANRIIRLFQGESFIVCSYNVPQEIKSAYTSPLIVELGYGYKSTISKKIKISKLTGTT